ncbi:MAG: TlpA family protein disulfide reductase [Bacteroidetes bacterium]|nr:TlpA family protein disulfide reductase [Bacteroidota bacterium]
MRNLFIGLALGLLLVAVVGFCLQFSSLIIMYIAVSAVTLGVSYFIRHWVALVAYLLPFSLILLWLSFANGLMFSYALPNMLVASLLSYFVIQLIRKYRYTYWKWVAATTYLGISFVIIWLVIPASVISYAGKPDEQLLQFPDKFPVLDTKPDTIDVKNKVLVLEFWSSTCTPCLWQMKLISPLYEKYKDSDDVEIIAVNLGNDDYETALKSKLKNNFTIPSFFDENKIFSQQINLTEIPVLIIVDKDKHIRWKHTGYFKEELGIFNERVIKEVEKLRQLPAKDAATIRSLP